MPLATPVFEANQELAFRINQEARANPQSPYAGKYVGLANGEVVVVTDDFESMISKLRQIEPDPRKCYGLEASEDLTKVHEIWSIS
jgi:hypothetical protein